jgi:hypothetical protein
VYGTFKPRSAKQLNAAIARDVQRIQRIAQTQRMTLGLAIARTIDSSDVQRILRNEFVLRGFNLNTSI